MHFQPDVFQPGEDDAGKLYALLSNMFGSDQIKTEGNFRIKALTKIRM